jgi:hypothetical protein
MMAPTTPGRNPSAKFQLRGGQRLIFDIDWWRSRQERAWRSGPSAVEGVAGEWSRFLSFRRVHSRARRAATAVGPEGVAGAPENPASPGVPARARRLAGEPGAAAHEPLARPARERRGGLGLHQRTAQSAGRPARRTAFHRELARARLSLTPASSAGSTPVEARRRAGLPASRRPTIEPRRRSSAARPRWRSCSAASSAPAAANGRWC